MFVSYPANFYNIKGTDEYVIYINDLSGVTQGNSIDDAIFMAQDYIGTWLQEYYEKEIEFPKSSGVNGMVLDKNIDYSEDYDFEKSFSSIVGLDIKEYVKSAKKTTVRRNVSIPQYLNEYAKRNKINVSKLISDILEEKFEEV